MGQLLGFIFSTGGIVVSLLIAAAWCLLEPNGSRPRRWLVAVAVLYTLASVHIVSWAISRPLVAGFRPFVAADRGGPIAAVVLLGGGGFTVTAVSRSSAC